MTEAPPIDRYRSFRPYAVEIADRDPDRRLRSLRHVIPIRENADWYARGVGGAAVREIKALYQPATCLEESINWRAGIRFFSANPIALAEGEH